MMLMLLVLHVGQALIAVASLIVPLLVKPAKLYYSKIEINGKPFEVGRLPKMH